MLSSYEVKFRITLHTSRALLVGHPGRLVQAEGAAGGAVLGHHAQPAEGAHQLLGVASLAARHLPIWIWHFSTYNMERSLQYTLPLSVTHNITNNH